MVAFLYSDKVNVHRRILLIGGAFLLIFFFVSFSQYSGTTSASTYGHSKSANHPSKFDPYLQNSDLVKPRDTKIIGWVFYGRKSSVRILQCYLQRNLVDNGGWLDEVHWVKNTETVSDLDYLEELLASSPRYKLIDPAKTEGFSGMWEGLEPGATYVKIDDDVVWFADDAIPRLVTLKYANPDYLVVSANMINSPLLGWTHYHMGAIHPYLPEPRVSTDPAPSWNYNDYPTFSDPYPHTANSYDIESAPVHTPHRWLRVPSDRFNKTLALSYTPIVRTQYGTWGTGLKSWHISAQTHYSFLENLADDALDIYKFQRNWLLNYDRASINFIVFEADDILPHLPIPEGVVDEEWITVNLPRNISKSVVAESGSLASHFSFFFQRQLEATDLLDRYWNFAELNVCPKSR